ncbi:hypothetical protein [Nocardioides sp.]|uniref:hypothetical protein n=1 Tax=Nocardioides sp. TaxID=35761 RepID=UPI002BE0C7AC|nr:hypothetical protein [Nocardioides sp.]HSX68395.1 hypothetical protein [Nocardioides sp.]
MTTHDRLSEEQWAAAVAAAGLTPEGALAPLAPAGAPAALESVRRLAPLRHPEITVDLLAAHGPRGWTARLAADANAHASAVRTLVTGRPDGRIGVVPGLELGHGTRAELLGSILRLVPGLEDGAASPEAITVPTEHVGAVIAATKEEDARTRSALLDLLGWDDIPDEVASLTRIDGDLTLTIAAPGRRTRLIRLLHGHEGWISTSIGRHGISYRRATGPWLTTELTWELVAALEVAR